MVINKYFIILVVFILATHTSSFASILLYRLTNNSIAFALPAINDLLLFILLLTTVFARKIKIIDIPVILVFCLVIVLLLANFIIISPADMSARVMGMRRVITLLIPIFIGVNMYSRQSFLSRYFKAHYYIFIAVALFGLIEYFIDISFWDNIMKLPQYWRAKGDLFAGHKDTVETSGKFFSYDLYLFLKDKSRRMVSFYAEAKPLASYCIFIIPFAILKSKYEANTFVKVLIIVAGLLTFSKGFVLVLMMLWWQKYFKITPRIMFVILVGFIFFGAIIYYKNLGFGPLSHISGLYSGFLVLLQGKIFGVGLGASGNYTSEALESIGGGESGLGAMIAQTGIIAILFVWFLYALAKKLYTYFEETGDRIYYIGFISVLAWYINFLYAEAALGFRGNVFVFLTIGMLIGYKKYYQKYEVSS